MGKPRSHLDTGWPDQWERVQRWHRRLDRIRASPPSGVDAAAKADALDEVFAFFMNCYHLTDWLVNDSEDPRPKARDFVDGDEALRYCRDVCNGLKHYRLDPARARVIPASTSQNWTTIAVTLTDTTPATAHWYFVTDDGKMRDMFGLADSCIAAWRAFLGDGADPIE